MAIAKKSVPLFVSLAVLVLLVLPAISFAAPLVPPCTGEGGRCQWADLMTMINNVIDFLIYALALPIAAIMFAYAGFKLVTSGGNSEARGTAKKIFLNTILGLVLAAASWLIIKLILTTLGWDGEWIGF